MIKFKDVTFKYNALNNPTIKKINFDINKGEKVLIVGKSGSGKSTISKIINGLIPNSYDGVLDGEAMVNDLVLGHSSIFTLSKEVGTILQDQDYQFVGLTTGEDIAFFLENCNKPIKEIKNKVNEVAKLLEIEDLIKYKPQELSGGEKQRVSVAGVLTNDVDYLLLDEPLANLDPLSSVQILELLDRLNKEYNKTIIMIEHRLEEAFLLDFDKVIVVSDGDIVFNASPSDLLRTHLLTELGIRKPLFIEALEKTSFDFDSVKDLLDYSQYKIDKSLFDITPNNQQYIKPKEMLKVENLKFTYPNGNVILKGVDFEVGEGEIVALLGNNGAGKSTLSSVLIGIHKEYEGDITINDQDIKDFNLFNRGQLIGYVMQNPNHSITEQIVYDEVAYALKLKNLPKDEIEKKVDDILEVCGLLKYKNWPINMLSYGQKRRVTIASVLVKKPKVLILDEPTAGQDYDTFKSMMKLIKDLSTKMNLAIVIITHNMQLAYEYCDRALVLNDGKIIFSDVMDKLYMSKDTLELASLRETSIQAFSKYHNIDSKKFGDLLKVEDSTEVNHER